MGSLLGTAGPLSLTNQTGPLPSSERNESKRPPKEGQRRLSGEVDQTRAGLQPNQLIDVGAGGRGMPARKLNPDFC